jgi:hypothetical protein
MIDENTLEPIAKVHRSEKTMILGLLARAAKACRRMPKKGVFTRGRVLQWALWSFLFFPFWIFGASIPFFTPPSGWEFVQPPKPDPYIQAAFLGKGKSDYRPLLNLAIEEIDVPLKEYLKSVREIHESEMKVEWRDLGPFTFRSGKGRLTEITSDSPRGVLKMLQGILVLDQTAYILTGSVLKEEFSSWQKQLLDALHSLTIVSDLTSAVPDIAQRSRLQEILHSFNHLSTTEERQTQWTCLQKTILEDFTSMGAHWQILMLKEGHHCIFANNDGQTGQKRSSL